MKIYFNVCNKYRRSKKTKILYIFRKTSSLYILYNNYVHEHEKTFQEVESIKIIKFLGLVNDIEVYQKIYKCLKKT